MSQAVAVFQLMVAQTMVHWREIARLRRADRFKLIAKDWPLACEDKGGAKDNPQFSAIVTWCLVPMLIEVGNSGKCGLWSWSMGGGGTK